VGESLKFLSIRVFDAERMLYSEEKPAVGRWILYREEDGTSFEV
jgi:hypothetical protein